MFIRHKSWRCAFRQVLNDFHCRSSTLHAPCGLMHSLMNSAQEAERPCRVCVGGRYMQSSTSSLTALGMMCKSASAYALVVMCAIILYAVNILAHS